MLLQNTMINCFVLAVDGRPIVGMQVNILCVVQPAHIFQGYTNSEGRIWHWSSTFDGHQYILPGTIGSVWRFTFITQHQSFCQTSFDYRINTNDDCTITLLMGSTCLVSYNHGPGYTASHATLASSDTLPAQRTQDTRSDISSLALDENEDPSSTDYTRQHRDNIVTRSPNTQFNPSDQERDLDLSSRRRRADEDGHTEACKRRRTI